MFIGIDTILITAGLPFLRYNDNIYANVAGIVCKFIDKKG